MQVLNASEEEKVDKLIREIERDAFFAETFKKKVLGNYIAWKSFEGKRIKAEIGFCERCQRKENLTIDHIIPIAILKSMGIDPYQERDLRNFRVLCNVCNVTKGMVLDFSDRRTKALLMEYLKRVEGSEKFEAPVYEKPAIERPTAIERWHQKLAKGEVKKAGAYYSKEWLEAALEQAKAEAEKKLSPSDS